MHLLLLLGSVLLVGAAAYCSTRDFLFTVVCAIYVVSGWVLARSRTWLFDMGNRHRPHWWSGRTGRVDNLAAGIYLVCSLGPLLWFAGNVKSGSGVCPWLTNPTWTRVGVVAYGALVSVAPHVWLWLEASAFFAWSAERYADHPDELKEQRERFKLNADGAKAIWVAIIALYAAVLLKLGCS